ncbi:MAG: DUF389 domain-containing protein [Bacteroidales bacterium]|nr:DUF389 domain-containing protein [Bacteroidales bacterium]
MNEDKKSVSEKLRQSWRILTYMGNEIDTEGAEVGIREGIYFRGAQVWILACSIIIASVGLNINSIPVIIGAMLISPLMGPIVGMGLSLGINDSKLLWEALRNFLVMVFVSLIVASLYFLVTPLDYANPTELEARTSPTIFDVFIAFFGGAAGMIEHSRKGHGTVFSGVAIATALMPPLCTAGYGIANGNFHFFGGAMMLFVINTAFIMLASYIVVALLKFNKKHENSSSNKRFRTVSSLLVLVILTFSVFSAVMMIRSNRIQRDLQGFIEENKTFGSSYIYDYKLIGEKGKTAEIYFAGDLSENDMELLRSSAKRHNLDPDKMEIKSNAFGSKTDYILNNIYERADAELAAKDQKINQLEEELADIKGTSIPYSQIAREVQYKYPDVKEISISRGVKVAVDSLTELPCINAIIVTGGNPLTSEELEEMQRWFRIRLNDTTVVLRQHD